MVIWKFLVGQQEEALKAGKPINGVQWKPFVRVATVNGKRTLRYLSADPASAIACVTCHNRWEQKPEIKQRREAKGVGAGKVFRMHELMGALGINVSLGE